MYLIFIAVAAFVGYSIGHYRKNYSINPNEIKVSNIIKLHLNSSSEVLLNNVTLRLKNGTTTQIDHILISTKGVFVIESKHYSGWVFGDENSPKWTQVIHKKKSQFQSPLRQNYKHIKAIEELLDFLPENAVKSVVVFSGSAKFKTQMPKNVLYAKDLPLYLSSFSDEILSLNRVQFCLGRLSFARLPESKETDKMHIKNLKSNVLKLKN
ncbi:nuclease-related domain-containing protein [Shewanella algae]|uniref:nuclease-related domain-containing protein n=1 Tax=Shewanella algae TaxID=38313 RepID=UPI001AAC4DB8|nr:nuclease-related domain-containing protein [Shewanella algae]MBO2616983.1 NERD domain-containing protein [Shewanella algae]MBO2650496.1 NERD domain-containing protein [Shewanella algae]MBO2701521.1 NERD domain-containing protein [Shewanella algae]